MKRFLSFIFIVCILFSFTGCSAKEKSYNKPIVAVTIIPQKAFVEAVCKDTLNVIAMVPSGASPETYEPTSMDMQLLENAKIYYSIGVPSETGILPSVKSKTEVIKLHKKVQEVYPDLIDDDGRDPHIWLSVARVKIMIEEIIKSLSEKFPENREFYQKNGNEYIEKLTKLDTDIKETLSDSKVKSFIAFHPSFNYFATDYGLKMYSLEEHGKETNAKHIAQIADIAKKENIKTVFYQAESSFRQAKAFAEEINGQAVELEPLSYDYIDNLFKMAGKISKVN